jgi:endo-1,4-beta-D-glucanase Y
MLSIQFSLEDPFNNTPTVYNSYDVWIDDVAFYRFTDAPTDNGLTQPSSWSASGANPFPQNRAYAGCTKPSSAVGKLIQDAYVAWKANYVTTVGANLKVVSPEIDSGATVSEGMAYGMLIAVYMGDKALFDGLYNYWKANIATGTTTLMNWKVPGGTGGSATDADEDAAFALLEASKQWPSGGYAAAALSMIRDIWTYDIDSSSLLPKGGSTYASANPTNPSYFAPAYYKEFAKVDTGHNWSSVTPSVVSAVYSALNSLGSVSSAGLVPGWCTSNCTAVGNNGAPTDGLYQYDAHRIPWRLGIDACWNGEARAATELGKIVGFFNAQSTSAGLSALGDVYNLNGTIYTLSGANSMSLIGSAGVGAMSVGTAAAFRDRAWQFLLEAQYTNNPIFKSGNASIKAGYTYYNATVGLLAMLTMSGNFYVM